MDEPPLRWIVTGFRLLVLVVQLIPLSVVVLLVKIPFINTKFEEIAKRYALPETKFMKIGMHTVKQRFVALWNDILRRKTKLGEQPPNTDLYSLDTKSIVKLLNFQKQGRPLVVNFGSCT